MFSKDNLCPLSMKNFSMFSKKNSVFAFEDQCEMNASQEISLPKPYAVLNLNGCSFEIRNCPYCGSSSMDKIP